MSTTTDKPHRHVKLTGGRMGFLMALIEAYSGVTIGAIGYTHGLGWYPSLTEIQVTGLRPGHLMRQGEEFVLVCRRMIQGDHYDTVRGQILALLNEPYRRHQHQERQMEVLRDIHAEVAP